MSIDRATLSQAAFYLAFAAAVATLISIAACQILIGAAFLALLISRQKLRFPPIGLPLGLFILGTLISCAFSEDPSAGWPQIRKFYVLLTIPIVFSTFRGIDRARRLIIAWAVVAAASAAVGMAQFLLKWKDALDRGLPFYRHYVGSRMTGFMSHWQTFGGQMMLAFLLLAAFILFASRARAHLRPWLLCAAMLSVAIVLGFTRNIWFGSAAGGLYLLWYWRRKLIALVPIALALTIMLGPDSLRERFTSLVQPHGEVDSNQHRIVTWRTGLRMIQAKPLLGLGPEHVGLHFREYLPPDVPLPLPDGWYGHLHNVYLHYAAERGIPTMLCLLWLFGKILRDFGVALRAGRSPEETWLLRGATAGVIAIMVSGFFEVNLGDTEVLTMFLAMVSCTYLVAESPEKRVSRPGR